MSKHIFKNLLNTLLVAIGLFVACYTTACSSGGEKKAALEKIKKDVETISKKTPTMVAPGIQLDKVELKGEETISYYLTMTNFDADKAPFDTESAKTSIIEALKGDQNAIKDFITSQLQIHYYYYDMNHKLVSEIKITPKDLQ